MLWTDESKYEVFGSKRRQFIHRRAGECFKLEYLVPTVKYGGGSVIMWGCFCGKKVRDLVKIDDIIDKNVYPTFSQEKQFHRVREFWVVDLYFNKTTILNIHLTSVQTISRRKKMLVN